MSRGRSTWWEARVGGIQLFHESMVEKDSRMITFFDFYHL